MQDPFRGPLRLEHRFPLPARDAFLRRDSPRAIDARHPKLGAVPGHVGVVPLQPAQPASVRADPRVRVEVGPCDKSPRFRHAARGVDLHYGRDRLAARAGVVLADSDQPATVPVQLEIGESLLSAGRQRFRSAAGLDPVQAAGRAVREVRRAVENCVRPAAVLVRSGPRVPTRREDVQCGAVGQAANQHGPAALRGPHFQPVGRVPVQRGLGDADGLARDQARRDRRFPAAVARPRSLAHLGPAARIDSA